jgi:hypothetical protein
MFRPTQPNYYLFLQDAAVAYEIANMAFISGGTNRSLSNKPPSDYLPGIIERQGEEALVQQCVPLDAKLHQLKEYPAFLEVRRELLAASVNQFLDEAKN